MSIKKALQSLAVVVLASLVFVPYIIVPTALTAPPKGVEALPFPPPVPPLGITLPCRIVTVHDGDTATKVTIEIDCSVRYLDCWAPEVNDPGGATATASAKQAEGKSGRLFIPLDRARTLSDLFTFGRVIGKIYVDGQTESESDRQVRLGYASTTKGGRLGE